MVLNQSEKTVPTRTARCLRVVADYLEANGFHLICYPLPANEHALKAYDKGGEGLTEVNKLRDKAGLYQLLNQKDNIRLADKGWKGLLDGTGCLFRVAHVNSLHILEFVSDNELLELVKVAESEGYKIEALHNTEHTVIYLYEPVQLPA